MSDFYTEQLIKKRTDGKDIMKKTVPYTKNFFQYLKSLILSTSSISAATILWIR